MGNDLDGFGTASVWRASPRDHFNLIFKQSYDCTEKRLKTRTVDTLRNLGSSFSIQNLSGITHQEAIIPQVSSVRHRSFPQFNPTLFMLSQEFLTLNMKGNVGWDGARVLYDLYQSIGVRRVFADAELSQESNTTKGSHIAFIYA